MFHNLYFAPKYLETWGRLTQIEPMAEMGERLAKEYAEVEVDVEFDVETRFH